MRVIIHGAVFYLQMFKKEHGFSHALVKVTFLLHDQYFLSNHLRAAGSLFKNNSFFFVFPRAFFFCTIVGGYFGRAVMHACQPSVII